MYYVRLLALTLLVLLAGYIWGTIIAQASPLVPVAVTRVKPIRVAVIDTGADLNVGATLCSNGHMDFIGSGDTLDSSSYKHGSNIAALIAREAGAIPYCLIILKTSNGRRMPANITNEALQYAIALKPDIINISWAGTRFNSEEAALIKTLLKNGTKIVAAAGNNGKDMRLEGCFMYPGCVDPRIYLIANEGPTSNFGPQVDYTLNGNEQAGGGVTLSGTSQSAARFTGLLVKALYKERLERAPSSSPRKLGAHK